MKLGPSIARKLVSFMILGLLAASGQQALAQLMIQTLVFVRHAETEGAEFDAAPGEDLGLNAAGRRRAQALARLLARQDLSLVISAPSQRAMQTAAPSAEAHGLAVTTSRGLDATLKLIQEQTPYRGTALVVGDRDVLPELIAKLNGPRELVIQRDEYQRAFVVTLLSYQALTTVELAYGP